MDELELIRYLMEEYLTLKYEQKLTKFGYLTALLDVIDYIVKDVE